MKDQEIYSKIGQLLYNEAPEVNMDVHVVIYCGEGFVNQLIWRGERLTKELNFTLSKTGVELMNSYTFELRKFFKESRFGEWNVMHYTLKIADSSFDVDFEYSEDLAAGNVPFWRYREKFK